MEFSRLFGIAALHSPERDPIPWDSNIPKVKAIPAFSNATAAPVAFRMLWWSPSKSRRELLENRGLVWNVMSPNPHFSVRRATGSRSESRKGGSWIAIVERLRATAR